DLAECAAGSPLPRLDLHDQVDGPGLGGETAGEEFSEGNLCCSAIGPALDLEDDSPALRPDVPLITFGAINWSGQSGHGRDTSGVSLVSLPLAWRSESKTTTW